MLGRQHDIKWITEGPNQGMLSVFSNDGYGTDISASSIHIISGLYFIKIDAIINL